MYKKPSNLLGTMLAGQDAASRAHRALEALHRKQMKTSTAWCRISNDTAAFAGICYLGSESSFAYAGINTRPSHKEPEHEAEALRAESRPVTTA